MAMIFPGMDPYLEAPGRWPGLHNSLAVYIRDHYRPYDYLACVNRAMPPRDEYELYPRRLPERLPRIGVPHLGC